MGAKPRPWAICWWVAWGPAVKDWGEGRVYCTDTLCCYDCDFELCLLVVSLLLLVFLAMSVPFWTLLGSCVLTWHPAGLAAVTCKREEPISLQGEGSWHLWLLKVSLRHCFHVFSNSVRYIYFLTPRLNISIFYWFCAENVFLILLSNAYDIFVEGCILVSIASCCVDIARAASLFGLVKVSCEDFMSDEKEKTTMYGNVALYFSQNQRRFRCWLRVDPSEAASCKDRWCAKVNLLLTKGMILTRCLSNTFAGINQLFFSACSSI